MQIARVMMVLLLGLTGLAACGAEDDSTGDSGMPNGNNNSGMTDLGTDDMGDTPDMGTDMGEVDTGNADMGQTPDQVPPIETAALEAWLDEGSYVTWPAESAPHESTGPHFGSVRSWVNDVLHDSLEAGNATHPVGSASIKELYGGDGSDSALGYSVMVKVTEGSGNDTWYWYEGYQGRVFGDGVGASICTGCHGDGQDFFLSPFPLQ